MVQAGREMRGPSKTWGLLMACVGGYPRCSSSQRVVYCLYSCALLVPAPQATKWIQENQLFLMYIPDTLRKQLEQKMLRQVEQVRSRSRTGDPVDKGWDTTGVEVQT